MYVLLIRALSLYKHLGRVICVDEGVKMARRYSYWRAFKENRMNIDIKRTAGVPVKICLLAASDKYDPRYYGSANLRFCVSDAKKFLQNAPISGEVQVVEVYDQQLTKANLLETIDSILSQLQTGDLFLYYTSSHGTYLDIQEKGKDVRMTGRCMYAPGAGNGDPVLWDRELIRLWKTIPEGVTVLTISDSCYSESQDRMTRPAVEYIAPRFVEVKNKANTVVPTVGVLRLKKGAGLISISASKVTQTSLEVSYGSGNPRNGGVFTEAFLNPGVATEGITLIDHFMASKRAIPANMPQIPTISFTPKSGAAFNRMKKMKL